MLRVKCEGLHVQFWLQQRMNRLKEGTLVGKGGECLPRSELNFVDTLSTLFHIILKPTNIKPDLDF